MNGHLVPYSYNNIFSQDIQDFANDLLVNKLHTVSLIGRIDSFGTRVQSEKVIERAEKTSVLVPDLSKSVTAANLYKITFKLKISTDTTGE